MQPRNDAERAVVSTTRKTDTTTAQPNNPDTKERVEQQTLGRTTAAGVSNFLCQRGYVQWCGRDTAGIDCFGNGGQVIVQLREAEDLSYTLDDVNKALCAGGYVTEHHAQGVVVFGRIPQKKATRCTKGMDDGCSD